MVDGNYYIIPQLPPDNLEFVGSVIGWGDTPAEAMDMVCTVAKSIKGYQIEVKTDAFDEVDDKLAEADKMGLNFIGDDNE
jgi:hypothetical protein